METLCFWKNRSLLFTGCNGFKADILKINRNYFILPQNLSSNSLKNHPSMQLDIIQIKNIKTEIIGKTHNIQKCQDPFFGASFDQKGNIYENVY
jgi:hypothetical protein